MLIFLLRLPTAAARNVNGRERRFLRPSHSTGTSWPTSATSSSSSPATWGNSFGASGPSTHHSEGSLEEMDIPLSTRASKASASHPYTHPKSQLESSVVCFLISFRLLHTKYLPSFQACGGISHHLKRFILLKDHLTERKIKKMVKILKKIFFFILSKKWIGPIWSNTELLGKAPLKQISPYVYNLSLGLNFNSPSDPRSGSTWKWKKILEQWPQL